MANRWQIMRRHRVRGLERTTTDRQEDMQRLVEQAQQDPDTVYIVVKDRYLNRRGPVWRRNWAEIDWWITAEPETPSIQYRTRKKRQ